VKRHVAPAPPDPSGPPESTLPVAIVGTCAFLGVYAPQPLLPLLARTFEVGEARAGLTISGLTLGVAVGAPVAGALSDRLGRVPFVLGGTILAGVFTLLGALAPTLGALVALRFAQGLAVAGVLAVVMGYVGDEWPERPASAMSAYVTGSVLGGFLGRFLAGIAAATIGWRPGFALLGALEIAAGVWARRALPPSRRFVPAPPTPLAARLGALRDPRLVAAYAVGFQVLFALVATFTYVGFHLDRPPYSLGPGALASIFAVYLLGLVVTPVGGRFVDRVGHRLGLVGALAMSLAGLALTLLPSLAAIVAGLALASSGIFVAQAAATSFVGANARGGRAAASGLYLSFYYAGGAAGAVVPAAALAHGGWPACVALIAAVELATGVVAAFGWRARA
jgi:predicted MFS family arabinose efflux permease